MCVLMKMVWNEDESFLEGVQRRRYNQMGFSADAPPVCDRQLHDFETEIRDLLGAHAIYNMRNSIIFKLDNCLVVCLQIN